MPKEMLVPVAPELVVQRLTRLASSTLCASEPSAFAWFSVPGAPTISGTIYCGELVDSRMRRDDAVWHIPSQRRQLLLLDRRWPLEHPIEKTSAGSPKTRVCKNRPEKSGRFLLEIVDV
jgi:hypothetical protein